MLFFVHHYSFFFSHSFNTFDKHFFTGISMVICKIGWSIRSWLSDYISFSFYKSYCRHDIYWILVAFMIAAWALIKVSRLYGLYRHLYTQLIYWHCAVILYRHVNLLNKRFLSLWVPCMETGPGARFTNSILLITQIIWKLRSAFIRSLVTRSQQNSALATTAQLSCKFCSDHCQILDDSKINFHCIWMVMEKC